MTIEITNLQALLDKYVEARVGPAPITQEMAEEICEAAQSFFTELETTNILVESSVDELRQGIIRLRIDAEDLDEEGDEDDGA